MFFPDWKVCEEPLAYMLYCWSCMLQACRTGNTPVVRAWYIGMLDQLHGRVTHRQRLDDGPDGKQSIVHYYDHLFGDCEALLQSDIFRVSLGLRSLSPHGYHLLGDMRRKRGGAETPMEVPSMPQSRHMRVLQPCSSRQHGKTGNAVSHLSSAVANERCDCHKTVHGSKHTVQLHVCYRCARP